MKVDGKPYRTIWPIGTEGSVEVINQTKLPLEFALLRLETLGDAAAAIRDMNVRGAPLIGVTGAYGVCLALREHPDDAGLVRAIDLLSSTRPTAVNLFLALARMRDALAPLRSSERVRAAYALAAELADEDVAQNLRIGEHGLGLLRDLARSTESARPIQVMTHCNAGWLATVDVGTALAPVYLAHDAGMAVHVWVSETRPRNQGAFLTTWELAKHGVPHTLIVDNAAGHLMQERAVDVVIVGTDRTTSTGDVANKIGTYMKALAAREAGIPFYVAAPSSSIDWSLADGAAIPIEERGAEEVTHLGQVRIVGDGGATRIRNVAFDITPSHLVTGLITERGVCRASKDGLAGLFPERARVSAPC